MYILQTFKLKLRIVPTISPVHNIILLTRFSSNYVTLISYKRVVKGVTRVRVAGCFVKPEENKINKYFTISLI